MAFPKSSAPSLENWQMQFNGLTMGAGTPYAIDGITGLDMPAMRNGDVARPRDHGEWAGLDVLAGRDVIISGDAITNGTSLQSALTALGTAFAPQYGSGFTTESPLWIQIPNYPCLGLMCRPRKRSMPIDLAYSQGFAKYVLQVHATDPRLYGSAQEAGPLTVVPFTGSSLSVTNSGNFETRPLLILHGPLTVPVVSDTTAGWQITLQNPSGSTYQGYGNTTPGASPDILSGDIVTIDLDTHAIVYYVDGVGTGYPIKSWLVSGSFWPATALGGVGLSPGSNTIEFNSDNHEDTGSLTVEWANAYLI